jgi:hypothetical protein
MRRTRRRHSDSYPIWRAEADNNAVAARSITLDAATRAFLQNYIKKSTEVSGTSLRELVVRFN